MKITTSAVREGFGTWRMALSRCGLVLAASVAAAIQIPAIAVAAESAGAGGLEEVIVTATRRAEPLSKVPVSIVAMDQQALDDVGAKSMNDIVALTPGIDLSAQAESYGTQSAIVIRGISSSLNTEPTTGVYIDDTPVALRRSVNSVLSNPYPLVFDLDRVEILRGPQGTLFGAGSQAGTVRFISAQPSLDAFSTYARAELASTVSGDPSYEAGIAAGGPIANGSVGYRVGAWYRRDGGYVDRQSYATGERDSNANWNDGATLRGALTFAPTDKVRITPAVFYQSTRVNDTSLYWLDLSDPGSHRLVSGNVVASPVDDKFYVPSLKIEANLSGAKLESISSYFYRDGRATNDGTFVDAFLWTGGIYPTAPGQVAPQLNYQKQNNLTQEIRLSSSDADARVSWVLGLFYSSARQKDRTLVEDLTLPQRVLDTYGIPLEALAGVGLVDGRYSLDSTNYSKAEQTALYGHADMKLTDTLALGLGLRAARAKATYAEEDSGPAYFAPTRIFAGSQSATPVTPQLSVKYQFAHSSMVYASAAKGYRLGGANGPIPSSPSCTDAMQSLGMTDPPPTYNSDTLWNYELGTKMRSADNRLSLDFSVFHNRWKDIQRYISLSACSFLGFTANLGSATSDGFDLQAAARLSNGLGVELAVGYTNAKFTDSVIAGLRGDGTPRVVVTNGDTLPGTTPWVVSLTPEYHFSAFGGKSAYVRAQWQYHSHNGGTLTSLNPYALNFDPDIPAPPSRSLLNLRAGMEWSGKDVSLFINNVTNAHPGLQLSHPAGFDPLYSNTTFRPLTAGITFTYRR